MADVNVSGKFDARGITTGMDRVEKSTQKLARSSRRSGFAFLEATRALEDFSVAGMRGAMNNLPGLVMSLGLGAGLAGASTVAALGIMGLSKAVDQFSKAANSGSTQAKAFGASLQDAVNAIVKRRAVEDLEKQMQGLRKAAEDLATSGEGSGVVSGARAIVTHMERQVKLEQELAKLRGEKVNQADVFQQDADSAKKAAEVYEQALSSLEAKMSKLEDAKARALEASTGDDDIEAALAKLGVAQGRMAAAQAFVKDGGIKPPGSALEFMSDVATEYGLKMIGQGDKSAFAVQRKAAEKALEDTRQLVVERQKELEIVKKRAAEEDAAMDRLQKAIEQNQVNQREAAALEEAARMRAEEAIKKQDAVVFGRQDDEFTGFGFRAPGLTSQAKSGLAGNEIQRAMNTLTVQRDMLKHLASIDRKTDRKPFVWT